jgi:hypothetical protein
MKPTKIEIEKSVIKDEIYFLNAVSKPIVDYYHNFIKAYRKDDRGLNDALEFILYMKEDVWPVFVDKRITSSFYFPYVNKEIEIIKKLNEELDENIKMIKEIMEKRKTLYQDEFSKFAYHLQNPKIYMDYVAGRDHITYKILDGEQFCDIIEEYRPSIESFWRKLNIKDPTFNISQIKTEEYPFLTFFIISAYDNLLNKLIEVGDEIKRKRILKNKSCYDGLIKYLFSVGEMIIDYNNSSLKERNERKDLHLFRNLAKRVELIGKDDLYNCIRKVYEKKKKEILYIQ